MNTTNFKTTCVSFLGFLLCSFLVLSVQAQQEPLFSQYRLNAFVINPAVAGSQAHHEIRLNYRAQWQQFPGAPRTSTLSYHGRTDDRSGLGAILFSDKVGPSQRTGAQVAYAYRIPFGGASGSGERSLALGFSGKMIHHSFRMAQVLFQQAGDPAALEASEGLTTADVSLGAYWQQEQFYAGFSTPNLIQSAFGPAIPTASGTSLVSQLYRHYFFMAGYRILYSRTTLEPSVFVKKTEGTPYQIEATMKWTLMDDHLMLGLGYRTDWLLTSFFALQNENWVLAYSADLMLGASRASSATFGPSHELTLGLDLGRKWEQVFRGE